MKFCCCSVGTASKIFAVIGVISYSFEIYQGYEQIIATNSKEVTDQINLWNTDKNQFSPHGSPEFQNETLKLYGFRGDLSTFMYEAYYLGIVRCVFGGIGLICYIMPLCRLVMPLLFFIPVDFMKGVVFTFRVGYLFLVFDYVMSKQKCTLYYMVPSVYNKQ